MRLVIGAVAAILTGLALATGVTVGLTTSSSPDKGVNLESPNTPEPWANAVGYDGRSR